ncbi:hypothetical protein D917_07884 [Trichinella nativa]|uniref:Uncharacterized protein n=1 Tax=Trichinella nativa TaxID=6335 RepID=A0A1Y3EM26_9BILA|nr:hypothetical protein D917_07884 [Trichinella nativa]
MQADVCRKYEHAFASLFTTFLKQLRASSNLTICGPNALHVLPGRRSPRLARLLPQPSFVL